MIGRGCSIRTQGGNYLPVEDVDEDHRFALFRYPTRAIFLCELGEPELAEGPRALVLLEDGRNLVLSPTLRLRTREGLTSVSDLLPGTIVLGPHVGVVSHVEPCPPGAMYHFPTLGSMIFVVEGIEAQSPGSPTDERGHDAAPITSSHPG